MDDAATVAARRRPPAWQRWLLALGLAGRRRDTEKFSFVRKPMTAEQVVELSRRTLEAAFWVVMPILLAAMAVGLIINIVQVMTSIQDATVSTVPRLTAVGAILFFLTPWMLGYALSTIVMNHNMTGQQTFVK